MINLSSIKMPVLKILLLMVTAVMLLPSCSKDQLSNDVSELRDMLDSLKNKTDELDEKTDLIITQLFELVERLNSEIVALQNLLRGQAFISDVKVYSNVTEVLLSDGTVLQLLPEKDMESFVTYIVSGGVRYWAYIDEDGKKQYFLDENNEAIPVDAAIPEVVEEDGEMYIVIGGSKYPLGGNSIFSGYELIRDELTDEVYAVSFTFGDDMTFTVTIDGAACFDFVVNAGWSYEIITEYYVANGLTDRIQVNSRGVVDYVMQYPEGWKVKEYIDPYVGTMYFDVTAPSKAQVEAGVAEAEGYLKVVAVLEGGKASITRLKLMTVPFGEFGFSFGNATVKKNFGLVKFVYGVCKESEYNENSLFNTAEGLLTSYSYPAGFGVSDNDLEEVPLAEILGEEPVAGVTYVLWAIPALYSYETESYYLKKGTFVNAKQTYSTAELEISGETFRDATLTMSLKGIPAYYMQLVEKAGYSMNVWLFPLSTSCVYTALTEPMEYEGSVFGLMGKEAEMATEYVLWIAVAEAGREYTAADVLVREFSTLALLPGSSVVLSAEIEETALNVSAQLSAEGAANIYYAYLTPREASKYKDDDAIAKYLFENGRSVAGTSAEANAADFIDKLVPQTELVLLAVATDASGKYSNVLAQNCATTTISYNDLTVNLSVALNSPEEMKINISTTGGDVTEYLYWIGKTTDNFWKSSTYLGGSAETAQAYMYLNSTSETFADIAAQYPVENGVISIKDHETAVKYVVVAMAKDAKGVYSEAALLYFTPHSVNIGNIVYSTDEEKWAAAKPEIDWIEESFQPQMGMMNGYYSFNITVPAGFTAYVLAGSDYYLMEDGEETITMSVEEQIIELIKYTNKEDFNDKCVDEQAWKSKGYPYGYEFYYYKHGCPSKSAFVVWAS